VSAGLRQSLLPGAREKERGDEDMPIFPDDELEFRLNWTHQGATVAVLSEMVGKANAKAAMAYTQKKDAVASAMRDFADEIEHRQKEESKLLHEYIAEDQRREHDFRSKMKASRPALKAHR
jgi:lysyl-tRNA synthetase class I